jgi:molecular chaperone GrpE
MEEEKKIPEEVKNTSENIDELRLKLYETEKALNESRQKNHELEEYAKRMKASLENMRMEKDEELNYVASHANQKFVEKLIEILDDMERIMNNFKDRSNLDFVAFQLMYKKFKNLLEAEGLKKIETSGKFDPFEHDAVERVESSVNEDWDIVEVTQNGYKFRSTVIRPAKVKVAMHVEDHGNDNHLNEGR